MKIKKRRGRHATRPTWGRIAHVIAKMRSEGLSLQKASQEVGISPPTVLRWGKSALKKNKSGRYVAKKTDRLIRFLVIPTQYGPREIVVPNSRQASLLGEYWAAVQKYLATGDTSDLQRFHGKFIEDASGTKAPLLTNLNELDRLGSAGVLSFESLYSRSN